MNDCSNLGNADDDSGCGGMGDIGVRGGVGVVIVDPAEIVRCLLEWGRCDNSSAVDIELRVDIDARLSNSSV